MGDKAKNNDKRLGNEFWKERTKHGRDKVFETPEAMWEGACEYFKWCIDNPIQDTRSFGQRDVQRPFTLQGLSQFLGVNTKYFAQFEGGLIEKTDEVSKGFSNVITNIRDVIFQQKFEMAVIGVYKENIIARDLGLADKQENKIEGGLQITGMTIK